jgi:hypothetical protein
VPDGFFEKVQRVAAAEDPYGAFRLAWDVDSEPAESVWAGGVLAYPLPFPAGLIADSLARFDRSFRYAMRSVERAEPVIALYERHARLPEVRAGFIIETVEAGSIRLRGISSDDIYRFLQSKPVVFVTGVIAALAILGLEPHLEFGSDAPAPPRIDVSQRVVNDPEFKIVISVDGEQVPIRCLPPVAEFDPDHPRGRRR